MNFFSPLTLFILWVGLTSPAYASTSTLSDFDEEVIVYKTQDYPDFSSSTLLVDYSGIITIESVIDPVKTPTPRAQARLLADFVYNDTDEFSAFSVAMRSANIDFATKSKDTSTTSVKTDGGDFAPNLNIYTTPTPAAFWLLGSSVFGLASFGRRKEDYNDSV